MLFDRLLRPWMRQTHFNAADAGTDGTRLEGAVAAAPPAPQPAPDLPLWTQAELNAHLNRLRQEEDRLLSSVQAVEHELSAVLSEYALARAGASPEIKRRLQRRFQRLTLRRSSLDQLHAEQLQLYRLLDHVEADLLRRELAGGDKHDTVLGVPLAQVREALELSVARSGHRHGQLRDTVEGLDVHQRDLALADHLGLEDVQARMDALTEAEFQHAQAQGLAEAEALAISNGRAGAPATLVPVRAAASPAIPTASHWHATDEPESLRASRREFAPVSSNKDR